MRKVRTMRLLIQRVLRAEVFVDNDSYQKIESGLLIFLGITTNDTEEDVHYLSHKLLNLRIFADHDKKMNFNIQDVNGEMLVISQFTLYGETIKGNRPSYMSAAKSEFSKPLYQYFVNYLISNTSLAVKTGQFGADMKVSLINDGPVTIWIDSQQNKKS